MIHPCHQFKGIVSPAAGKVKDKMNTLEKLLGYIPEKMANDKKIIAMKIVDNAMGPRITAGDIVIARQQEHFTDNEIALIGVYGMGHICRKVRCHSDGIELIATNTDYKPIRLYNADISVGKAYMIGKVIELRATL